VPGAVAAARDLVTQALVLLERDGFVLVAAGLTRGERAPPPAG
jgi:hypothetical protein